MEDFNMPHEAFDFEKMALLAKEDPQALETWLEERVEELIMSSPIEHHHRLRGLQFQIDMERKRASNPLAACIKLSQMMHESFSKLRQVLNEVQQNNYQSSNQTTPTSQAKVIPFARSR
ncbi:DUF3135 domain-containing protein [Gynuella sunshinyii]|nr:DUF3135 domain-containing protein [Gynuella sunshinyii]